MPNREKVIKGLNNISREIINTLGHGEAIPYLRTIDDAIALLKEQDAEIDEISDEYLDLGNEIAKMPKVVRCKDCKFYTTNKFDAEGYGNCKKDVVWRSTTTDWFCADGVRND